MIWVSRHLSSSREAMFCRCGQLRQDRAVVPLPRRPPGKPFRSHVAPAPGGCDVSWRGTPAASARPTPRHRSVELREPGPLRSHLHRPVESEYGEFVGALHARDLFVFALEVTEYRAASAANPQAMVKALCKAMTKHGPSHFSWNRPQGGPEGRPVGPPELKEQTLQQPKLCARSATSFVPQSCCPTPLPRSPSVIPAPHGIARTCGQTTPRQVCPSLTARSPGLIDPVRGKLPSWGVDRLHLGFDRSLLPPTSFR